MSANRRHSTMPRKHSGSISASDLVKLLPDDSKRGFLRERCISKFLKKAKWSHRFVVLANGAIYIYENEMSKAPDMSLPLMGYIGVEREKSATCAWVFALVPGMPSMKRKSFACASDLERKQWMSHIRDKLLITNNIERLSPSSLMLENMHKWKDVSAEEREYLELEIPVMSSEEMTSADTVKEEASKVPADSESDDDDEEEKQEELARKTRDIEAIKNVSLRKTSSGSEPRAESIPPRYSAVVEGEEHEYQNYTNNPKAITMGLEKACTIMDSSICMDRDKCIDMLKSTKRIRTYLIRKSRSKDYKVLAFLCSEDVVKEYRIEEAYGMYHFVWEPNTEFKNIDALLSYYSAYKTVPNLNMYLGWGIHECVEGDGMYEPVDD